MLNHPVLWVENVIMLLTQLEDGWLKYYFNKLECGLALLFRRILPL